MKRIHVIGGKNHGKTTLIVELVRALKTMNLRVGTIKHTHHEHELDTPGKDSHRHREAGAEVVGICSPNTNAVFWRSGDDPASPSQADSDTKYNRYSELFSDCDIVLVEGDSHTTAAKVEVWRNDAGSSPLALDDTSISAVVTDDALPDGLTINVWRRSDVESVAKHFLSLTNRS